MMKRVFAAVAVALAGIVVGADVFAAAPKSFPAYVTVPSGAYLDTDVFPDRTTVCEVDFQTTDLKKDKPLFGVRLDGFNFGVWIGKSGGQKYDPYWGSSDDLGEKSVYHPLGYSGYVRHLVRLSRDGLKVDGITIYAASGFAPYDKTGASSTALRLWGINGEAKSRVYLGRAYRATIWHGGVLVRNYVPSIDANDVACFYDTVSGACVYSSSSTAFTAPTEATEGDYRIQDDALQVRVKAISDEPAGCLSINGGAAASEVEAWVTPGSSVTLAATTTDATSAVFRRWPERIPTATPENATVTVTADYAIVVTNRVFARVNDYVCASGGTRAFNNDADWRSGTYPAVNLNDKTEVAWARTGDILYLTNEVASATFVSMANKMLLGGSYDYGWKLGTVVGDPYHTLGGVVTDGFRTFLFEDASRFRGYVRNEPTAIRSGWNGPILHVRPAWTNTLPQYYCTGLSYLLATSEGGGGFARAERLFGRGLFMVGWNGASDKCGAAGSRFLFDHLEEGPEGQMFVGYDAPIDIRGKTWDVPEIADGAALHLDASLAETRTVTDGCVTEWRDADGGDVVATKFGTGSVTLGTSTNGLGVIACGADAAFRLSKALKAKELFVVFRDLTAYNVAPCCIVGNDAGVTAWQRHNTAGYLFRKSADCSGATKELEAGEVWLDGTRVEPETTEDFRHALHVVAGGLAAGSSDVSYVGALKSDSWVGNIELAEVLVYEKSLTPRERQQTCDALRKKWQWKTASKDWDLGSVVVERTTGGSGDISITEGRAAFRELKYPDANATFVKKGDGRMEVGRLAPDGQSVTVEGGRFALKGLSAPVKLEMAANPCVWLDASQSATLVPDPTDDALVCRWNDPRGQNEYGVETYATNRVLDKRWRRSPQKVTDTPTGLTALDLGTSSTVATSDAGVFEIKNGRFLEGFFVVRHTADAFPLVATGNWDCFGGSGSCLLSSSYCTGAILGGHWTINGETVRPDAAVTVDGTYYVIGLKALRRYDNLNYLGQGRNNSDSIGGVTYGEVIYYDRILTDEERRNTEAYLMKKWLGKDHPAAAAAAPTVPTMTFAAGVTNVVEADCDLAVTSVVGSSDSLEKAGSGDVTVGTVYSDALRNVTVSDGTLTADLKAVGDRIADTAYIRYDASNPETITTYQKDGTTYVSKVVHPLGESGHDVATAGAYKEANRTNDVFLSTVTIGGRERTVFDFGEYCHATNVITWTSETTAVTNGYLDVPGNSASMRVNWTTVVEAYVVMRERPEAREGRSPIISCWPYTFDREAADRLCGWWCTAVRNNGLPDTPNWNYWFDIDGATVPREATYPEGWHVFSYCGAGGSITFMNWGGSPDRDNSNWMHLGGQQIAEFIGFTATNTSAARVQIRDYLRAKWLGVGPTLTLDRVAVAAGSSATLATADGSPLAVKDLTGGGSFATDSDLDLSTVGDYTFNFNSATDYNRVSTTGALTLKNGAVIRINILTAEGLPIGTYPLITAASISGRPSGHPIVAGNGKYAMVLRRTSSSVDLVVRPVGTIILFR